MGLGEQVDDLLAQAAEHADQRDQRAQRAQVHVPAEEPAENHAEQDAHEADFDLTDPVIEPVEVPVEVPVEPARSCAQRRDFPTLLLVAFIDSVRGQYGVEPVCRVLSDYIAPIHPSTYYAAKSRPASARALRDAYLAGHISRVFHDKHLGRGLAGARKVTHLLSREGISVARCTVERLMRDLGLKGARRGRRYVTTRPGDPATSAARPRDLVNRDVAASAPNELWLVDFTYVPTAAGMVFTAFVSDACTRVILGWRTAARHDTDLPLDALNMALWVRAQHTHDSAGSADSSGEGAGDGLARLSQVVDTVHHSDAGAEYTSIRYRAATVAAGLRASIGTVGDSYDNAQAESLTGLYKTECIGTGAQVVFGQPEAGWSGVAAVEAATADWADWFNRSRLHSSIGYATPMQFEQAWAHAAGDISDEWDRDLAGLGSAVGVMAG